MFRNVEQTQKMIPFITDETAIRQNVGESVFGMDIFDLNLWVQVDSVTQPIWRNSVCSRHVSHRRTSAIDDHLDSSIM